MKELDRSLHVHSAAATRSQLDVVIAQIGRLTEKLSILPPDLQKAQDWVEERGGDTMVIEVVITPQV